jgi:hypothetical protein
MKRKKRQSGEKKGEPTEDDTGLTMKDCEEILRTEREVWRRSSLFRLGDRITGGCTSECEPWPCERDKQSALVSSLRDNHSSISIWFTSFEPEFCPDHSEKLFFSADDVIRWVQGSKHLAATRNLE